MRLDNQYEGHIESVVSDAAGRDEVVVVLTMNSDKGLPPALSTGGQSTHKVVSKPFGQVKAMAGAAIKLTSDPKIKAEAYFIIGRLLHHEQNFEVAIRCYKRALGADPEMHLAALALGQLELFQEQNIPDAVARFTGLRAKLPEDRDVHAYLLLANSMLKGELVPFDKLRESAMGFHHAADLWLLQAQIRQVAGKEYPQALKCYEFCLAVMEAENVSPQPSLYANIAALFYATRNLTRAREFCYKALVVHNEIEWEAAQAEATASRVPCTDASLPSLQKRRSPQFSCQENRVFFRWTETVAAVRSLGGGRF